MTPETKRRLKKEGKAVAAARSAALRNALHAANPAPLGSDEWMENDRRAKANEAWLRETQPEHLSASEAAERFLAVPADELGVPGPYVECLSCHDVLYSYPKFSLGCRCGSLTIKSSKPPHIVASGDRARAVVLFAKGTK
jgi:hypothetical protein